MKISEAKFGELNGREVAMQVGKADLVIYFAVLLFKAALYGLFSFFAIYRGLAGSVMLYSYLWNIAAIIALLLLDKLVNETLLSNEFIITKRNYFISSAVYILSLISFRSTLYLFYIAVLVVSRMSILDPALFDFGFKSFLMSIEYCLILLVVFDKFFGYLLQDDERVARIASKFRRFEKRLKKRQKTSKNP